MSTSDFKDFTRACIESNIDQPVMDSQWHPLERTLKLWSEVHGVTDTAQQVKRFLSHLTKVRSYLPGIGFVPLATGALLKAFSKVFRGDEVGVLGEDIAGYALRHPDVDVRWTAVHCLEKWAEDEYRFLEVLADRRDHEDKAQILQYIENLLKETGYCEPSECPVCNEDPCVTEEDAVVCEACEEPVSSPTPRQELAEWQQLVDKSTNYIHCALCTDELPRVLEDVVGIHPHLTLDFIESIKIGQLSTRATSLGMFLGSFATDGSECDLWFWHKTYAGHLWLLYTSDPGAPERWALTLQWS